jgi:uncharacterized protein with HEPN domain
MYILQIGELSNKLSDGLKAKNSDVPWRNIIGMRNLFAHDYENIDIGKVWEAMRDDIAPLRERCLQIVLKLEPDYNPDEEDELLADDEDDNFTMEILRDLVAHGYSGDELIEKFSEQRANIRTAVKSLINEADEIAARKRKGATTKDIFGEE